MNTIYKSLLTLAAFGLAGTSAIAQSDLKVNTPVAQQNQARAIISAGDADDPNNNDGLIVPRINAFPGNAGGFGVPPAAASKGMLVYLQNTFVGDANAAGYVNGQTYDPGFYYWSGLQWLKFNSTATITGPNPSFVYNVKNGLNKIGDTVMLGGTLTKTTDIATAGNNLTLSGTGKLGVGTTTPGSTMDVKGSIAGQYTQVTSAAYAMAGTDYYVVYKGAGAGNITLPAAAAIGAGNFKGRVYLIKNGTTAQTLVVSASAGETIDGTTSVSVGPNQSVTIISNGLTGSTATWETVSYNNSTQVGPTPDYIFASLTPYQDIGANTNVIFNVVTESHGITLNGANGIFTLQAGKTYELAAYWHVLNFSSPSAGDIRFRWYKAATFDPIPASNLTVVNPSTYSAGVSGVGIVISSAIYTPTTDVTVRVVALPAVGSARVTSQSYVIIKQLK